MGRRAGLRPRPGRWRGRLRRLLPAARRARGLRPAARPGGDDPRPAGDVGAGRRGRGRDRTRRGGRLPRRLAVSSYYGRPVLKEPVWQPEIPWYFFTGGAAAASGPPTPLPR